VCNGQKFTLAQDGHAVVGCWDGEKRHGGTKKPVQNPTRVEEGNRITGGYRRGTKAKILRERQIPRGVVEKTKRRNVKGREG